jgi:hypothetical protein
MSQQPPMPGAQYPYAYGQSPPRNHPQAVPSLVLGILSIVLCGLFTGIPAMVLGRRALREIRGSHGTLGGEGMAQGGFWTGLIGTAWTALVTLFVLAVFAFGGAVHQQFHESCERIVGPGHHHQVRQNCG